LYLEAGFAWDRDGCCCWFHWYYSHDSFSESENIISNLVAKTTTTIRIRQHMDRIRDVSLVVASILLFAVFIHNPWPGRILAIVGLAGAAIMIGFTIRHLSVAEAFGLSKPDRRILIFTIPAAMTGLVLGIATRNSFDLSLLPAAVTGLALVAPLIGAVEELIFRGFIQGHLRPIGRLFSIAYASTVHTCYKLLVILTLSIPLQFDFFFLVFWTFLGGLAFGTLREFSRSSIPPVIAHAIFDVVLYGGMSVAPIWVWS
jgi:membrane protease YdiL (CAAX protease family)